MTRRWWFWGAALIMALRIGVAAQDAPSVWNGVYTDVQATRGARIYDRECASCHGAPEQGGSMAPALAGATFSANYDGMTVGDLFDRNRTTMPVGREGQLTAEQNADITAYLLKVNGFPAGTSDLPSQSAALKQIQYVAQKPAHQDHTPGREWIRRLERPERIPGLRLDDVIRSLVCRLSRDRDYSRRPKVTSELPEITDTYCLPSTA